MNGPSAIKAILQTKCPRCRKGNMFLYPALHIAKFDKMPKHCPVCQLHYEIEPGFYWGAMYISYGFSVGIVLIVGVLLYYLASDPPTWVYLTVVSVLIVVSTPILFRYARVIMLYLFGSVSYDPRYQSSSF
ncbi:MAG: DUF983 domain-containing protein [Bacteroidota bacterium]|nr:DUF983 domain-containing protein [Bacteroidota bacterium]